MTSAASIHSTTAPPLRTKKGLSYVLGDSKNLENHILPVNAIQYSSIRNSLYTAGRDGTIKIWQNGDPSHISSPQFDFNSGTFEDQWERNEEFQDLNEKILKLETSISSKPIPYYLKSSSSVPTPKNLLENIDSYSVADSYNIHFDWINDLKLVNNDNDLVSCSSDLSIKLINLNTSGQSNDVPSAHENSSIHKFPNVHTDYIKKISYSKNQNQLVSGALDGKVVIWDLATTKPLRQINNCASLSQYPSSIYSLSNNESHLISTGGPNNAINLFDNRANSPFIRKLIGHQDNIRCLLMNDNFILSGSSDSSVKLWDLRNFKVYKNFDIHDYPVWSLTSNSDNLSVFYSGDKGGNIVKTDLSYLSFNSSNCRQDDLFPGYETFSTSDNSVIDEKLGISIIVAQEESPILSLCKQQNTLFSSNYTSMNRNMIPNIDQLTKYQYFRNCLDYSIEREIQINDEIASGLLPDGTGTLTGGSAVNNPNDDLNSDFYDLVSHLSMDTNNLDIQSSISNHISVANSHTNLFDSGLSSNEMLDTAGGDTTIDDDEYVSMLLNVNGGPSKEFVNAFKDELDFNPGTNIYDSLRQASVSMGQKTNEDVISGSNGFIDETPVEILLNPIPKEQITSAPFNVRPIAEYKILPKSILAKRLFNNKREILVLYSNGDIKLWDILICQEVKLFPYEHRLDSLINNEDLEKRLKEMEQLFQKHQTTDTLNNWCEVEIKAGKLLITLKESSFMNVEIYYDDLVKCYPFLSLDHPENQRIKKLEKVVASNDDRFYVGSILLNSLFSKYAVYEWEFDGALREELRQLKKNNKNLDNTPILEDSNSVRKLKYFGRKSSKSNLSTLGSLGSRQASPATSTATSLHDFNLEKSPMSEFLLFNEGNNRNSISSSVSSQSYDYDDTIMKLLQGNKRVYWEKYNAATYGAKSKIVESIMKVDDFDPSLKEAPISEDVQYYPIINPSKYPSNLLIIIFEHSPELGNYRDVCSFQLEDTLKINYKTDETSLVDDFRAQLPKWIGQPILYNRWPQKESPKIAFQLLECDYSTLPINKKVGGKTQRKIKKLPVLESSIKLTSHNMLRVGKILFYLTEKFDSKTSEMKDKKLVPTDWLVLDCKGEELPNNMTLQTIKTKIWKSNSDIELRFRRKYDT